MITPIKLGENSLGQQYMQYDICEGNPEDRFDYSADLSIIEQMKAEYALLLVEIQTAPTSQNIEYALQGCKRGLTHIELCTKKLEADVDIADRKVATGFKVQSRRNDIIEKWYDPDWPFRIDEVVSFYTTIKDFNLNLLGYLSELSTHAKEMLSQSQLERIAQLNIEIASNIAYVDKLASHLPKLSFFLEIANYNLNFYGLDNLLRNADPGYYLYVTESIFSRLYQSNVSPEYASFFLVTASRCLRTLIENSTIERQLKDRFCALFVRIDSEIQSYNSRNAVYYHNTNPIFFAEIKHMQRLRIHSLISMNKADARYIQIRKHVDFEKNPEVYLYTFYHEHCMFGQELLTLLKSSNFKYENNQTRELIILKLQQAIKPLQVALSYLLPTNALEYSRFDITLKGGTCDFIASTVTAARLCTTIIENCINCINAWTNQIAKQRRPASDKKLRIEKLCSEITAFLNEMEKYAIESNRLKIMMLRLKLAESPIDLEMLHEKALHKLKLQLKIFAKESRYELYDVENEMLYKPLDEDFIVKFLAWVQAKSSQKLSNLLNSFQNDINQTLAKLDAQTSKSPKTTSSGPSELEKVALELSEPKHKKRRKKKKAPSAKNANKETSEIDFDFTPETEAETPEIKVSEEEVLLDKANNLMSQKRWDDGYEALDESIKLAIANKNHLIHLRSLHARIAHKIGYVNYIKNQVMTYEQLQRNEVREDASKVIRGMEYWIVMIHTLNYLITQNTSFKGIISNLPDAYHLPKSELEKIRTELTSLEKSVEDDESFLKSELDKITTGQKDFHNAHPNMPKKGFGVFGELTSYTRSAMGAFAGLKGALSLSRAQLNKPSHIIVGENIDGDSVNHIRLFLSRRLGPDEQKSSLGILTELYNASASTGNIIVNSAYKDELFKAQICDANGAILESVKAYLRTHLVKTSDSPLSFTYGM